MKLEELRAIHVYNKDLKNPPNINILGLTAIQETKLVIVHDNISVESFLLTPFWTSVFPNLINNGENLIAIITQHEPGYSFVKHNLQLRNI